MSLEQERHAAAALETEFPPFQVWTDLRSRDDGGQHWHARQPGWTPEQIISAWDADDMRDRLIIWQRRASAGTPAARPPLTDSQVRTLAEGVGQTSDLGRLERPLRAEAAEAGDTAALLRAAQPDDRSGS